MLNSLEELSLQVFGTRVSVLLGLARLYLTLNNHRQHLANGNKSE